MCLGYAWNGDWSHGWFPTRPPLKVKVAFPGASGCGQPSKNRRNKVPKMALGAQCQAQFRHNSSFNLSNLEFKKLLYRAGLGFIWLWMCLAEPPETELQISKSEDPILCSRVSGESFIGRPQKCWIRQKQLSQGDEIKGVDLGQIWRRHMGPWAADGRFLFCF